MAQRKTIPARLAITIAVAMASPTCAQPPDTSATDWDDRIRQALVETGQVNSVAVELAQAAATPATRAAQVRVALEQGNLVAAELVLRREPVRTDAESLGQLSRIQEILGQNDDALASLNTAIAATKSVALRRRLNLRLALLMFDAGRSDEANAVLRRLVELDSTAADGAGLIGSLYGQYATAADCFGAHASVDKVICFWTGNAELHAGRPESARHAFECALDLSTRPGDRAYATERLIAAARAAKALPQLADAWLARADLPPERFMPLATVLRELGRTDALLQWWRKLCNAPQVSDSVLSDRLVNEVLGAAQSAGRSDDTIAICRQMLAAQPDRPQWLNAVLRAEISAGHFDAADALLRQRLDAAKDNFDTLLALGHLAERLDRDAVAIDAADRLGAFGGGNAIAGRLLAASAYTRQGDPTKADQALQLAARFAEKHPVAAGDVSSALEAAGQDQQAIELLNAVTKNSADLDLLSRLASLQLKRGNFRQAMPILEQVMHAPASDSVRSQAGQRLLEAAVAAHATSELIRHLQERLDTGKADPMDLSLLVDARLAAGDFDAAVRSLRDTPMLNKTDRLWRLSVLFLRANRLEDADATLRELVDADPANAAETLERVASVELRRNRPAEAEAAIAQVQKRAGSGLDAVAMMAGVDDRLGQPGDAADQYRRLLAAAPANASNWLLWATAMSKSGRTAVARRRLEVLCGETTNDAVFAIGIDGLINLNARPDDLRVVRRDAMLRLVERPDQMILYHVLGDLSEELADPAVSVHAIEAAVAVSDEERAEILRELMESATQNGLTETAVDCGRSLLALGDEFPPQLFLQLGQQLLMTGRLGEALQALGRAADCADPDYVIKQAADLLERNNEPAAALNMLRPIARRRDVDLDRHVAELDEVVGQSDDAYTHYLASAEASFTEPTSKPAPLSNSLDVAALGALMSARTSKQTDAVLAMLSGRIHSLIAAGATNAAPPPELAVAAHAMRLASAFCDQPERADAADAAILSRWSSSAAIKAQVVQDRVSIGRFKAADALKLTGAPSPLPPSSNAQPRHPSTAPLTISVDQAARTLPALIVRGDDERARIVLNAAARHPDISQTSAAQPGQPSTLRTLMIAASLLGDVDAAAGLSRAWADAVDRRSASISAGPSSLGSTRTLVSGSVATAYFYLVDAGWRYMPNSVRAELISRLQKYLSDPKILSVRATLSLDVLLMSADLGSMPTNTAALAAGTLAGQRLNLPADTVGRAFAAVPEAMRPDALRAMCAAVPPARRLNVLTAAVGRTWGPLDDATVAAIDDLAAHLPPGQQLDWGDWFIRADRPQALRVVAEAALRGAAESTPGEPPCSSDLAAASAALANAGDADRADAVALKALDSMALYTPPSREPGARRSTRSFGVQPEPASALRVAVAAMSSGARNALLSNIRNAKSGGSPAGQTWQAALRSVLLEVTGDRHGALDVLRDGLKHDANDLLLLTLYRDRLVADGRAPELAELAPRLAGSSPAAGILKNDVVAALRSLFRAREIPSTNSQMPPADFASDDAAHNVAALSEVMRSVLLHLRMGFNSPNIAPLPDSGGLPPRGKPASTLDSFTLWPGVSDIVLRTLHCATLNGTGGEWLAELVSRAAEADSAFHALLLSSLSHSAEADTMSPTERLAVAAMIDSGHSDLPISVLDGMWPSDAIDLHVKRELAVKWAALDRMSGPNDPLGAEPGPLDFVDDLRLATWLASVADRDVDDAARQVSTMRGTGRIPPRAINTRLVAARIAAERGDIQTFASQLQSILQDWAWQQAAGSLSMGARPPENLNLTFALPARVDNLRRRGELISAAQASLTRAEKEWPSASGLTRAWALLGDWVPSVDGPTAAELILKHALDIVNLQPVGEQALCVADLADRLEHHDVARQIQIQLLEARCLPAVRIAPLLQELRRGHDIALADRLRADAILYCHEPQLHQSDQALPSTP